MKTLRERLRDWAKMRLEVGNGMLPFVVFKGKADEAEKIAIYNQALEDVLPFISSECERARGEVELDKADAQIVGFKHGKSGYDLISLIQSMCLTSKEWTELKRLEYASLGYLTEEEKEEVEASLTHTKL